MTRCKAEKLAKIINLLLAWELRFAKCPYSPAIETERFDTLVLNYN